MEIQFERPRKKPVPEEVLKAWAAEQWAKEGKKEVDRHKLLAR